MYLIQLDVNFRDSVRYINSLYDKSFVRDKDFILKTILTENLSGSNILRPWSAERINNGIVSVLGYSDFNPGQIRNRMVNANPKVKGLVSDPLGYELPSLKENMILKFSVKLSPTISVNNKIKDVFLYHIERYGSEKALDRLSVYENWFLNKLEGCKVLSELDMPMFDIVSQVRKKGKKDSKYLSHSFKSPVVVLTGVIQIKDPVKFLELIKFGFGRQKAYGFGMMKLAPIKNV